MSLAMVSEHGSELWFEDLHWGWIQGRSFPLIFFFEYHLLAFLWIPRNPEALRFYIYLTYHAHQAIYELSLTMILQLFRTMADSNENSFLLIQPISDSQALISDFVLFSGFPRTSSAVQEHLTVDSHLTWTSTHSQDISYVHLLYIFGLLVFVCKPICKYLWRWLKTHSRSCPITYYEAPFFDNQ